MVVAALTVVVMRGRWWFLGWSITIFLLVYVQATLGYTRVLDWHVPLGVLTVGLSVFLAITSLRRTAGRPREVRR